MEGAIRDEGRKRKDVDSQDRGRGRRYHRDRRVTQEEGVGNEREAEK